MFCRKTFYTKMEKLQHKAPKIALIRDVSLDDLLTLDNEVSPLPKRFKVTSYRKL